MNKLTKETVRGITPTVDRDKTLLQGFYVYEDNKILEWSALTDIRAFTITSKNEAARNMTRQQINELSDYVFENIQSLYI